MSNEIQNAEYEPDHPPGSATDLPTSHQSGQTNEQLESPFFCKLPGELRAMIFTHLLGNRRVHLEYMLHPRRSDARGNTRRWRAGICEIPTSESFRTVVIRPHFCLATDNWRPLQIAILFTCQRAYEEAAPILYQTTHFLITNSGTRRRLVDDLSSLQLQSPTLWSLIRSLELQRNCPYGREQAETVPHLRGRVGYEALWDTVAEMPALAHVRIALLMPLSSWENLRPPYTGMRELYFGPMKKVEGLRSCEVLLPTSFRWILGTGEEEFKGFGGENGAGRCQYRLSWPDQR